jgi:hypothetical protein
MIVLSPVRVGTCLTVDEFRSLRSKQVPRFFVTYQLNL